MVTAAVAPTVLGYNSDVAYLTVAEFKRRPTGLNLNTLVLGGNQADQDAAVQDIILRASRWCDNEAQQALGAQQYVQQNRLQVDPDGYLRLTAEANPLVRVLSVLLGPTPLYLSALTDLSGVWIDGAQSALCPTTTSGVGWVGGLGFAGSRRGKFYVKWTYEAGFVATTLTAPSLAGATSVTVADPTGIIPGAQLRLVEAAVSEFVTVGPAYTSGAVIPLAAPTTSAHTLGAGVSGVPDDIKEAVGLVVAGFVKERGSDSLVMNNTRTPTRGAKANAQAEVTDFDKAREIIKSYRRVR